MDNSINLVGVHWQPSHNRHPVDGALVGAGSLFWLKDALRMKNTHNILHVNWQTKICLYQMSIIRSMKNFNVNVILDHFVKSPNVPNHKKTIKTQWFPKCKFLVQGNPFGSIENWEVPMQTKVKLCTCLWRVIHQFVSNKITTIKTHDEMISNSS
jgi:hypothetical protein